MMSNELGALITKWRELRKMSQTDLFAVANLSSPSIVNRTERGETMPTLENVRSIAKALGAESQILAAYERALLERKPRERAALQHMELMMAVPADWRAAPLILLQHASLQVVATSELRSSRGFAPANLELPPREISDASEVSDGEPPAAEASFQEVECVGWIDNWRSSEERPAALRQAIRFATLLCISQSTLPFGPVSTSGAGGYAAEAPSLSALSLFLPSKAHLEQRRGMLSEILGALEKWVQRLNTWQEQDLAWRQKTAIQLSVRLDMQFGTNPQTFRGSNSWDEDPLDQSLRRVVYYLENFRPRWELLLDSVWIEIFPPMKGRL